MISKYEWHDYAGYLQKGGDRSTPQVSLAGKWLAEAGFEVGTGVSLKVLDGGLVLIPDSREQAQLARQQREMEQARQQALALLAQAGG